MNSRCSHRFTGPSRRRIPDFLHFRFRQSRFFAALSFDWSDMGIAVAPFPGKSPMHSSNKD